MGNMYKPEQKESSIVLLGNFNPLMFTPEWFKKNDIFTESDLEQLKTPETSSLIISPQLTYFQTSNLVVNISNERIAITAKKESFSVLTDTIKKIFANLSSVSVSAFGINFTLRFAMPLDKTQNFADKIAPKNRWNTLLEEDVTGDNRKSGLLKMIMQKKTEYGWINFTIEPWHLSNKTSTVRLNGVVASINNHFQSADEPFTAEDMINNITKNYDSTIEKITQVMDELFEEI